MRSQFRVAHCEMSGEATAGRADLPTVISEADIWRSALAMVKRYKDDAMQEAAMRADQRLEDGDWRAAITWHRILDAIERLQAQKPAEGVH
jgi:hypothetical protein